MSELIARLNRMSVEKHYDAYADVDWDAPEMRIDPEDPVWELGPDEPLSATAWYRELPAPARARLGLHVVASTMKIGLQFENILQRGLLEFAASLPDGDPEFRYAYHEVIEEAQHTLMFQEFVNRAGLPVGGLSPTLRFLARRVVRLGGAFPELFFVFVLGGEDPIDHVQRRALSRERPLHPLLKRIMQIHITEEARHLAFARHYLRRNVPRLCLLRRARLRVSAPFILGTMARLMMRPAREVVRHHRIPRAVLRQAYRRNPGHHAATQAALGEVRELCRELDLVAPPLWRLAGL
jgi:hypothetical protein